MTCLKYLQLRRYGVHGSVFYNFAERLNVILGLTGTGKSQLLDTIAFLSLGGGFFNYNHYILSQRGSFAEGGFLSAGSPKFRFRVNFNFQTNQLVSSESNPPFPRSVFYWSGGRLKCSTPRYASDEKDRLEGEFLKGWPGLPFNAGDTKILCDLCTAISASALVKNSIVLIDSPERYLDENELAALCSVLQPLSLKGVQVFVATQSPFVAYCFNELVKKERLENATTQDPFLTDYLLFTDLRLKPCGFVSNRTYLGFSERNHHISINAQA